MLKRESRKLKRTERKRRVRAKVSGTSSRPRLAVFRSLRNISVQAIDDAKGVTVAAASVTDLGKKGKNTIEGATEVGKLIASKLVKQGIEEAVFDRAGYKYHGKIKALADGIREGGLKV